MSKRVKDTNYAKLAAKTCNWVLVIMTVIWLYGGVAAAGIVAKTMILLMCALGMIMLPCLCVAGPRKFARFTVHKELKEKRDDPADLTDYINDLGKHNDWYFVRDLLTFDVPYTVLLVALGQYWWGIAYIVANISNHVYCINRWYIWRDELVPQLRERADEAE